MPPRSLFVVKYWCVLCLLDDYVCWLLISGLWLFGCFTLLSWCLEVVGLTSGCFDLVLAWMFT